MELNFDQEVLKVKPDKMGMYQLYKEKRELDKTKIIPLVIFDFSDTEAIVSQLEQKGVIGISKYGWVAESLTELYRKVENFRPVLLTDVEEVKSSFTSLGTEESPQYLALVYPYTFPTYQEQQDAWLKDTKAEVGDVVEVFREGKSQEEGWGNYWFPKMNYFLKTKSIIKQISSAGAGILLENGYWFPFTALNVFKKPKFRPYKSPEEFLYYLRKNKGPIYDKEALPHVVWVNDVFILVQPKNSDVKPATLTFEEALEGGYVFLNGECLGVEVL